jgi:hypothetical protein
MYGPGTAVVAAGTAGFEAVSAPESVREGQPRSGLTGVTPTVVPAARSAELPCTDDPELFREPWGVWGGELFLRGQIVPRKRPRGRPRKHDVAA